MQRRMILDQVDQPYRADQKCGRNEWTPQPEVRGLVEAPGEGRQ